MSIAKDTTLTSGALRGVTGPLVRVPFNQNALLAVSVGAQNIATDSFNPDGSASNVLLTVFSGVGGTSMYTQKVQGRVVGVRYLGQQPGVTNQSPFLDVVIDGVAYALDSTAVRFDNLPAPAATIEFEALWIVDDGLPDTRHDVTVVLAPDIVGGTTRQITFYGYSAEKGRSYSEPAPMPRETQLSSGVALTTSAASIPYGFARKATGLAFYNSDASTRIVTVYGPTGVTAADVYLKISLAAGQTVLQPLPSPRILRNYKWLADAGAVVYGKTEML